MVYLQSIFSKPPHVYFSARVGNNVFGTFMHFTYFYSFISFMFAGL